MKSFVVGILCLCNCVAYTQKRIAIGALVPEVVLNASVNGKPKKIPLSSYRGKWVIIDFWGTTCSVCIKGFSHIDSLQKKFGNKLQFIVVTEDNIQKVKELTSRVKFKFPDAPLVFSDKILSQMFPYTAVPLHVWIDDKGYVRYITSSFNANEEVIASVLAGKRPNLSRQIQYTDFDRSAPLLTEGGGRLQPHLKYYSCVLTHLNEVGGNYYQLKKDGAKNNIGLKIINQPLLAMYQYAAGRGFLPNEFSWRSRVVFETNDSAKFFRRDDERFWDDWEQNETFSYESNLPPGTDPYITLMQDLNNYFPFKVCVEKRKVLCHLLVRTSFVNKVQADTSAQPNIENLDGGGVRITNQPLSKSLIYLLSSANENNNLPFIDGTGFEQNSTLKIVAPLADLVRVRKELQTYDMDLREEVKEIPMLVIKDK